MSYITDILNYLYVNFFSNFVSLFGILPDSLKRVVYILLGGLVLSLIGIVVRRLTE